MKRTVIQIDENLCNGCGNCVTGCHEGALQLVDGKAVMVSDLYCDGLGACIGECPVGAITFMEREAKPYDEIAVMERLVPKGEASVLAHLKHLHDHGEAEWVRQGVEYLDRHGIKMDLSLFGAEVSSHDSAGDGEPRPEACRPAMQNAKTPLACGCPGSMAREIRRPGKGFSMAPNRNMEQVQPIQRSELSQFPVQLHLLNPQAGFLRGADLLLAADCTAFASGEFHGRFLRGKSLAIACPKLDSNTEVYVDKLTEMIDVAKIDTLTVLVMEVPCCRGLVRIAQLAREQAERNIPIKVIVLSVAGEVVSDQWI